MTRKLKPDRGIQGLIPAILSIVFFFLNFILFDLRVAFNALGILMIFYSFVFGFWSFYKSKNYYMLICTFYLLTLGMVMLSIDIPVFLHGPTPQLGNDFKILLLFLYVFMFWMIYVGYLKKLKYRGREIMELAAWDVEKGSNTYTERPRPAGEIKYSKYDILDFANYMKKTLVCMAYEEKDRVLLVPIKMGEEFNMLYNPNYNYLEKTWISFGYDGQVSVHISRKDYLNYKEDLAFDHLCESLGQVMILFAELYMSGNKVRITDRLNSVKIGLFS